MRTARWPALAAFAVLIALAAAAGAGMLLYLAPPAAAQATVDYDLDNDGLIDVDSLDKLNAIRWDLGGSGNPAAVNTGSYAAAFPNRITAAGTRMGCPSGACAGYELTAFLNFDANGDGYTISNLLMNNSDNPGRAVPGSGRRHPRQLRHGAGEQKWRGRKKRRAGRLPKQRRPSPSIAVPNPTPPARRGASRCAPAGGARWRVLPGCVSMPFV